MKKIIISMSLILGIVTFAMAKIEFVEKEKDPSDMFIFYSTSAGNTAWDGDGRNSPFAEAFLKNVHKKEALNLLAVDIASETYKLTSHKLSSQRQRPEYNSRIINNKTYSIASNSFKKRYALLIGINNYKTLLKLKNAANDVQDIAKALTTLGYEVDLKVDITQAEIIKAVNAFKAKLASEKESEGFFWFAGLGLHLNGKDYLLPADADMPSENRLEQNTLSLQFILSELENAGNKINLVFIDVNRDTYFFDANRKNPPANER